MTQESEAILRISQEDLTILITKKKLSKIPDERAIIKKPLSAYEKAISELDAKQVKILRQVSLRERLINLEKKKLDHSNEKMMAVSNQKEYMAMQKEINETTRIIRRTEDQILELEERIAPLKTEIDENQTIINEKLKELNVELGELDAKEKEFLNQIKTSQSVKLELNDKIPAELKQQYENLTSRNIIPAAIESSTASCQGCAMAIRSQVFNDIIRDGQGTCPTCKRIVFYKAPEPPPEQEKKKKK